MAKFKVVLFEPMHSKGLNYLEENKVEILYSSGFEPDQIRNSICNADAIIARALGRFDGTIMDYAPNLKIIGRHGIGVDNIDIPAATERGIFVVNTPTAPAEAVAEYVPMAMGAIVRRIIQADSAVRNNDWDFRNRHVGPEFIGKTLGIIGFGRIGRRIAEICGLGYRMKILYNDAFPAPINEENRLKARRVNLDHLLSKSDFISLNVPLLDSTHHLIDRASLNKMSPHAYLINCSRGPVVDEQALIKALKSGQIAGAVIDVYEKEPVSPDNPLLKLKNVLLSPHISGHSEESAQNMSMVAADIVCVLKGKKPKFPVNVPTKPRQLVC